MKGRLCVSCRVSEIQSKSFENVSKHRDGFWSRRFFPEHPHYKQYLDTTFYRKHTKILELIQTFSARRYINGTTRNTKTSPRSRIVGDIPTRQTDCVTCTSKTRLDSICRFTFSSDIFITPYLNGVSVISLFLKQYKRLSRRRKRLRCKGVAETLGVQGRWGRHQRGRDTRRRQRRGSRLQHRKREPSEEELCATASVVSASRGRRWLDGTPTAALGTSLVLRIVPPYYDRNLLMISFTLIH